MTITELIRRLRRKSELTVILVEHDITVFGEDVTRWPIFRIAASGVGYVPEGRSVLLVEQNGRMALEVADHVYVLDNGVIVHSGNASSLAADEDRVPALTGVSAEVRTL